MYSLRNRMLGQKTSVGGIANRPDKQVLVVMVNSLVNN